MKQMPESCAGQMEGTVQLKQNTEIILQLKQNVQLKIDSAFSIKTHTFGLELRKIVFCNIILKLLFVKFILLQMVVLSVCYLYQMCVLFVVL